MADGLDRDTARALAGICRDCPEPALNGELGAKCLAKAAGQRKRQRQGRADAGVCIEAGCGKRVEKVLREDGSAVLRRCAGCARKLNKGRRSIRRSVTGDCRSVTGGGADPSSSRVARTKVERAYAKLADGTERFIERVVFRSRGAQSKESQDVDGVADVEDAVELLAGHAERLRELRAVEGSLGRIARDEARAAVADRLLRATRLLAGEAARITPEGWRVVRDGLARIGERDDE